MTEQTNVVGSSSRVRHVWLAFQATLGGQARAIVAGVWAWTSSAAGPLTDQASLDWLRTNP